MFNKNVALPSSRAFVIQLHGNSAESKARHRGRVEHITSGQAAHFVDEEEFWALVDSVLSTECPEKSYPEPKVGA